MKTDWLGLKRSEFEEMRPDEFTDLLQEVGFTSVAHQSVFGGVVAFHKAKKGL